MSPSTRTLADQRPATRLVLVVDDDPASCRLVSKCLTGTDARPVRVLEGDHALSDIGDERPDLILLAAGGGGQDGLDTLEKLRRDPALENIPVIFLSGRARLRRVPATL